MNISIKSQFGDGMRDNVWPVKLTIVGEVEDFIFIFVFIIGAASSRSITN